VSAKDILAAAARGETTKDQNVEQTPAREPRVYRIVRFREGGRPRTLRQGLTLAEAQAWCQRADTHGTRAGRRWFDGYDYMRGSRP